MFKKFKMNAYIIIFSVVLILILAIIYNMKNVEKFTNNDISVEYYFMPNCGHCKKFNSTWDELLTQVSGVSFKKYDITDGSIGSKRSDKFNINSAPTIIKVNKKTDKIIEEFNGNRTLKELKSFVNM